ncbi:TIGR03364 family FAD-dependent oxidoreductase [Thalassoroseus pseudoceratinae]|uniref:TIGR03364 family FAD-dependent oxidoreductase n=1 Tax=Thalassoroseus pseudoceratinae TaxID=2713176 RepID=UPI0014221318|nr:TIGR03364 family FAD-dependent oxidoreductase [Thalassoroseus pseudoceratinae]
MSTTSHHAELLVIGGGVLGTFFAYHGLERGKRVVLLERHQRPQGATVRNFGQVVPSGLDQHWQQYGRESLQIYQAIQSQFDISVRQQGSIYIASDDDELTLLEELRDINQSTNYPSELWTPQQCLAHYPGLRSDYCRGGLFFSNEVSVNPRAMIHRLHEYLAEQSNFTAHFQTCVKELNSSRNGLVEVTTTDDRVLTAENVVLCCGSEFQLLYPQRFQQSDLKLVKLQMLKLKPQSGVTLPGNILTGLSIRRYESFSQCPSWTAIKSREEPDTFHQRWGVHILFKQEEDGGIILGDSHEYAPANEPEKIDFDLRGDINIYFIAAGKKIFDLPNWEIDHAWYGVYSQTSHPQGIYTETIDERIHIVTGIGGKGMTSSAGFAKHHLREIDSN